MSEKVRPGRECRKCGESQRAEMVNDKSKIDGHGTVCKACANNWQRAYHKENPEAYRDYYERNRGRLQAKALTYRAANVESLRAKGREYSARRVASGDHAAYMRRRRALIRGSESRVTRDELSDLLDLNDYMCVYCSAPWEHWDHVVPLSRGGHDTAANLVPACAACNLSKSARCPLEFWGKHWVNDEAA